MPRKPYKAKSLPAAQRRIRAHEKLYSRLIEMLGDYTRERRLLAMLAAAGPAFSNPIAAAEATKVRDEILAHECRMKLDGSWL